MLRVAHFSDIHYAQETLDEVDRCFSSAVVAAMDGGVDVAVLSGDATDHKLDLHAPAVLRLASQIRILSNHCPVLILHGTFLHEPPGTLDILRFIGGKFPVYVADRIEQVALTQDNLWVSSLDTVNDWNFENQLPPAAKALFSVLPSVNKGALVGILGVDSAAVLGDHVADLLSGFATTNKQAAASGVPTIGVSHGTVSGCRTEHGVPMAGLDHEFTVGSLFGAGCSAFLLGHIHQHQSWEQDGRMAAYAGSIGRLHYGEEDPKGWILWEVSPSSASLAFHETPARRLLHLDFPGTPDMDQIRAATAQAKDAFIRVRWQVNEEHNDAVDRKAITDLLKAAGACAVKLEGRVLPVVRTRAEGITRLSSVADKVTMWAETTHCNAPALTERLSMLGQSSPEEIASRILRGETPPATPADQTHTPVNGTVEPPEKPYRALFCHPEIPSLFEVTDHDEFRKAMDDGLVKNVAGIMEYEMKQGTAPAPARPDAKTQSTDHILTGASHASQEVDTGWLFGD